MAGLTSAGFVSKTTEELVAELEAELLAEFPALNTKAGIVHQLISIFGAKLAEVWELAEAVYAARSPGSATGTGLDQVCEITGTLREPARRSTVPATVNLNAGVTLPAGSIAQVDGDPTARFRTVAAVTNSGGSPANVAVEMESESTGAVVANAGTLTVIVTPVSGWNSVTNALDAELGSDIETDAALRLRREQELKTVGGSTVGAIRADVLQVDGVTECTVFENVADATDGDGVPPHAFEVLVRGGDDAAIAQAIFDSKPAGALAHGDESEDVVDSQGVTHAVGFTRPTEVEVYLEIDVDVDPLLYPATGDTLIATAVAQLGDETLGTGDDVVLAKLYCAILDIAGVVDITEIRVGTAPSPVSTANLAIGSRSLALLDTSRIVVTSTEV